MKASSTGTTRSFSFVAVSTSLRICSLTLFELLCPLLPGNHWPCHMQQCLLTVSRILLAFSHFSCLTLCSVVNVGVNAAGSSLSAKSRSISPRRISISCFHLLKFPSFNGSKKDNLIVEAFTDAVMTSISDIHMKSNMLVYITLLSKSYKLLFNLYCIYLTVVMHYVTIILSLSK